MRTCLVIFALLLNSFSGWAATRVISTHIAPTNIAVTSFSNDVADMRLTLQFEYTYPVYGDGTTIHSGSATSSASAGGAWWPSIFCVGCFVSGYVDAEYDLKWRGGYDYFGGIDVSHAHVINIENFYSLSSFVTSGSSYIKTERHTLTVSNYGYAKLCETCYEKLYNIPKYSFLAIGTLDLDFIISTPLAVGESSLPEFYERDGRSIYDVSNSEASDVLMPVGLRSQLPVYLAIPTAVPEPSTLAAMLFGLTFMLCRRATTGGVPLRRHVS
jgi:hypothetical protein